MGEKFLPVLNTQDLEGQEHRMKGLNPSKCRFDPKKNNVLTARLKEQEHSIYTLNSEQIKLKKKIVKKPIC